MDVLEVIWHGLRDAFLMAWEVWWALALGFAISAIVQAWAPRERIQKDLGWTCNDWGVGAMEPQEITRLLAEQGYASLAADPQAPAILKRAAAADARELPPICILAGGLGTRLGDCVRDTPKPLLEVAGEPFLAHQLRMLSGHGARRVVLCVGYLGEQIRARLGDERFGIEHLLGTGNLGRRRAPAFQLAAQTLAGESH